MNTAPIPAPSESRRERLRRIGFQPGKSGNPRGKRKGTASLALALTRLLRNEPERLERIAATLCDAAAAGDVSAARLLFERLDGSKPTGFFSVNIDNSDRRTAVQISPQLLGEIAEARRKHDAAKLCQPSPTT
jgi:hypothetical protein